MFVITAAQANYLDKAFNLEDNNEYGKAEKMYLKGCQHKEAVCCTEVAKRYESGEFGKKDMKKAISFYNKGCDYGDGEGCLTLGGMYKIGDNIPVDKNKADKLLKKGCNIPEWKVYCQKKNMLQYIYK